MSTEFPLPDPLSKHASASAKDGLLEEVGSCAAASTEAFWASSLLSHVGWESRPVELPH
ncbi:hypothetical protein [Wolbachia endosymbiont of Atemnus politus]|uniref:hypothetical protein n=1 Tax=Wolbachia endosymbiont of Atemnus politus TaxID=2682840 RepID=UPI00157362A0|nr:hypothetical protein [Wolbachia endosymbiont of Atemnus politus]